MLLSVISALARLKFPRPLAGSYQIGRVARRNCDQEIGVSLPKTSSAGVAAVPNQNMIPFDDRNCLPFRPHGVRLLQVPPAA